MNHVPVKPRWSLARLIGERLVQLVLVVWAVTSVVFVLQVQSGDPVGQIFTLSDEATRLRIRRELGYMDPLEVRYARFWQNVLIPHDSRTSIAGVLDFGASTRAQRSAIHMVLNPLRMTAGLLGVSLGLVILLGVPLGVLAAFHNRRVARVVCSMKLIVVSVPAFLIGMALLLAFARDVPWRLYNPTVSPQDWGMPVIALMVYPLLRITNVTRQVVATVLQGESVIAARAAGLREMVVFVRHIVPGLTGLVLVTLGADLPLFVSTTIIIEWLLSWPGAGQQLVVSNFVRDYNVILAIVFLTGIAVILFRLVLDVLRWMVDPLFRAGITTQEPHPDTLQTLAADAVRG